MRKAIRRAPVATARRNKLKAKTFPAPSRGWILNENLALASPASARRLDNWFPTPTGARARKGTYKWQEVSASAVESIWNYKSGSTENLFAADETSVFDITTVVDADTIPDPVIQGQTSGYYSTQQFSTAGGDFVVCVNGTDVMWQWDGSNWYPVNTAAVNTLNYDGGSVAFARGETVTGAGGASATVLAVLGDATSGTLYIGPVTSSPFIDDEVLTGSVSGAAVANGAESSLSTVTITNVDTDRLSQVWSYAERLFFVEKDTKKAWYLPADSIGGAATSFSLAGVFKQGGSLLFGATWSLDAGDGLDDKCVFVSTEGEVAVYEGIDPASWSKVGVYQIGTPLGLKAHMRAGGDLLIATDVGLVPLTAAIQKDIAALSLTSASRPIEPAWKTGFNNRGDYNWEILKWTQKSMMIVTQPRIDDTLDAECFVANLETGAWCRFTGIDPRCTSIYDGRAFFGANDGIVYEMERTGADNEATYVCTYVGQFDQIGAPEVTKTAQQARAHFITTTNFNYKISASVDYDINLPTAPSNVSVVVEGGWDDGEWDVALWGGPTEGVLNTKWASIGKTGFSHAPQIQITLGDTTEPGVELNSFTLTYTQGAIVV